MGITTIKTAINHLSHIRLEESTPPVKALMMDLLKCLKIYPVKCRFAALLRRI